MLEWLPYAGIAALFILAAIALTKKTGRELGVG